MRQFAFEIHKPFIYFWKFELLSSPKAPYSVKGYEKKLFLYYWIWLVKKKNTDVIWILPSYYT